MTSETHSPVAIGIVMDLLQMPWRQSSSVVHAVPSGSLATHVAGAAATLEQFKPGPQGVVALQGSLSDPSMSQFPVGPQ